jgi:hypothetical protein
MTPNNGWILLYLLYYVISAHYGPLNLQFCIKQNLILISNTASNVVAAHYNFVVDVDLKSY